MEWKRPPRTLELEPDTVDVWRIDLERAIEEPHVNLSVLSEDERLRANRFRFPLHRDRFVASRATLRRILGKYVSTRPDQLLFTYGRSGKPELEPVTGDPPLRFNLAHSENVALCAVSLDRPVGIDLERVRRDLPFSEIARRYFAPSEISELQEIPENDRAVAFFHCWARKEAVIKAKGEGIPTGLRRFVVSVSPRVREFELREPGELDQGDRWSLRTLDVGPGFTAALAVKGYSRARLYRWLE